MRVKTYELVYRAVEEGIEYGLARNAKYEIAPDSPAFSEEIERGVMSNLSDIFEWDGE